MSDIKIGNNSVSKMFVGNSSVSSAWYKNFIIYQSAPPDTPLTLTAIGGTATVALNQIGEGLPPIRYSLDGINWNFYVYGTNITLNQNEYIQFWNSSTNKFSTSSSVYGQFVMSGADIHASGKITSLNNFSNILTTYTYYKLFMGCTTLVKSPIIPKITIAVSGSYLFGSMFESCTSLTYICNLDVSAHSNNMFDRMFCGCTSLYISDTQTGLAQYTLRLPKSGNLSGFGTLTSSNVFTGCLGTRSSNNIKTTGTIKFLTWYTQNSPLDS